MHMRTGGRANVVGRSISVSYDTLLLIYALKYQQHAIATMDTHKAEMGNYYRQCVPPSLADCDRATMRQAGTEP